jgi:hypothetical protein
MPRHDDQFNLRLPEGWREAIKSQAVKSRRSMNSEILAALESVVEQAATGNEFGDQVPAAADQNGALQGSIRTNG